MTIGGSRRIVERRPPSMRRTCGESSPRVSGCGGSRSRVSGQKWRESPSSPAASSRHDPPTSAGTWPSGDRIRPGAPGSRGRPPGRRSSQGSTSPSCRRNGSDAPTSWEVMPVRYAALLGRADRSAGMPEPRRTSIRRHLVAGSRRRGTPAEMSQPPSARRRSPVPRHRAWRDSRISGRRSSPNGHRSAWPRTSARCAASSRVGHLLEALGPRPVHPADHAVWRDAAKVIDDYRARWGVPRGSDALGTDDRASGISSLPTARLIDHLETTRHIEVARQRLGWRAPRQHEMDRGR